MWGGAADFGACALEVRSTIERIAEAGEVTGFQTLAGLIHVGVLETALGWLGIAKGTTATNGAPWPSIAPFLVRLRRPLMPIYSPDSSATWSRRCPKPLRHRLNCPVFWAWPSWLLVLPSKVTVSPESGYEEPLNIFVAVGMESGNRKTAVLQAMAQPFAEWERMSKSGSRRNESESLSERKTLEAQIETRRKKAAMSLADSGVVAQIAELEAALPEVPALPRLWVQDVTPEKLAVMMAEHGERIALLSDEGGVFDLLAGRYSKGIPNLDLFLQAHSGSSVRVDRGSRPPVLMQHPALTVAIAPQPDVLQKLSDQPGFRGRGLLARFLVCAAALAFGFPAPSAQSGPRPGCRIAIRSR